MVELANGQVLAGYRIEGQVGRGGMGVVYRATQLALERPVALKLIAPDLAQDPDFRGRFKRESLTAAQIEHPHVIPVHEAGEADGQLFIAMRLIDGIDLREVIRRNGRVEPRRAVNILSQVASALDAAHGRGLVHRDIKPGNVLIANEGGRDHAYLTDFGLSKHLTAESGMTATGTFVGTVDYIAPEQIQGLPLDARSDVYSLGCLLYHTLTGRVPFERDSDVAKIFAHMSEPPPPLGELAPGVPPQLEDVLRRAMAKEPAERYPSAGDLARAANAAVEGGRVAEPERSVATGAAAPSTRIRGMGAAAAGGDRRLRTAVIVLAAMALVAIAVAVVAALSGGGDDDSGDSGAADAGAFRDRAVIVTPIRVDSPGGVATGESGTFVTNYKRDTLTGIDGKTGELLPPLKVLDGPTALAVADRQVWVVNSDAAMVSRVDLDSGDLRGAPVALESSTDGDSITAGEGKVWVAMPDQGQVLPIDAESGTPGTPIKPPDGMNEELVYGDGALWVLGDKGTLTKVDSASGKPGDPIKVGEELSDDGFFRGEIAFGEGSVWVAGLDDETLVRVDPASEKVMKTIRFPDGIEGDLAVGDGSVVTVNEAGQLLRVDPQKGEVAGDPVPAGTAGTIDLAIGEGAVWITGDQERNTLTRVAAP